MTEAGYARILLDKKDTQIMGLESEITKLRREYERQIKKLQKENAKLKEAVKHFNPCGEWNDDVHDCEFRHYAMEYGSKLTKAKELLKRYVKIYVNPYPEEEIELRNEAEQFLNSEVDK